MLTLYGFQGSRSIRIAWLLEELRVPYTLELFTKPDFAKKSFPKTVKDYSPTGEVPALKLEDGTMLVETGYIVEYILDKYGKGTELVARNEHEARQVAIALYAAEGNIMTDSIILLIHNLTIDQAPYGISFVLKQLFGYIDSQYALPKLKGYLSQLSKQVKANGNYLVGGHLSGADIVYAYSIRFAFDHGGLDWKDYPILSTYISSLEARPAYEVAKAKHAEAPTHT